MKTATRGQLRPLRKALLSGAMLLLLASCAAGLPAPVFDHIVIVIEENQDATAVMGSPYISSLAARGTTLTRMYGIVHPSQPNYIALFSGSLQEVTDNTQHDLAAPCLATALAGRGLTFASYSEGLPSAGWRGWESGRYVRRHNPVASFINVPDSANLPLSSFPSDLSTLPTVAFVIPNLDDDMHDGSVAAGDAWLAANLDRYVQWAATHNSMLILTFDECAPANPVETTPIATVLVGQRVARGESSGAVNLYSLLHLVLDMYGIAPLGEDGRAPAITGIWN